MLYSYWQYRDLGHCAAVVEARRRHRSSKDDATVVVDSTPPESSERLPGKLGQGSSSAPQDSDDAFLVAWDADEAANPQNWSATRKWALTLAVTTIAIVVGVGASITSASSQFAAEKFGVSVEVMELETAVFLIGFGVSAPLLGPLSELGGRVPVYVITLGLFSLFEVGSALAPNIQTRIICRFFAGFMGSSPLSNAGGSLADIVSPRDRTYFFPMFAQAGFSGPVLGPVMGGWLGYKVSEEWCDWLVAIWGGATTVALFFLMPETFSPVLLRFKAKHIRKATGDDRYETAAERERKKVSMGAHFGHALAMPFLYLLHEPIVLLISLYLTAVYIILFSDFEAYSIIFGQTFGFNPGEVGLAFLPVAIGLFTTLLAVPGIYKRWVRKEAEARARRREDAEKGVSPMVGTVGEAAGQPEPEERLFFVMLGGWLVPAAMFYQAWTTFDFLPPWPALSAGILFGAGILTCFISSYQYVIDVYGTGSASALASLTFVRYVASGGAVMFARPLYNNLGARWAQTLLAFISLAFYPVPFIFYFYGKKIRSWSRYARA